MEFIEHSSIWVSANQQQQQNCFIWATSQKLIHHAIMLCGGQCLIYVLGLCWPMCIKWQLGVPEKPCFPQYPQFPNNLFHSFDNARDKFQKSATFPSFEFWVLSRKTSVWWPQFNICTKCNGFSSQSLSSSDSDNAMALKFTLPLNTTHDLIELGLH